MLSLFRSFFLSLACSCLHAQVRVHYQSYATPFQARRKRAKRVSSRRKQNYQERHAANEAGSSSSDDDDTVQPVRILKEYWGPTGKVRKKFSQRLFQVLFTDGSKEVLVAEDVVDGWAEPFEENEYYSSVLVDWRKEHAKPARPPCT